MRFHSFDEMLRYYAETTPDAPAIKTDGGQGVRTISHAALCRDVDERANQLTATGKTCLGKVVVRK